MISKGNLFIAIMVFFGTFSRVPDLLRGECVNYIQGIQQCGWSAWVGVGMTSLIGVVLVVYEGRKYLNRKRKSNHEEE